jgi:putative ABC transport system permease protein
MSWLAPLDIGLTMGLIFAGAVVALAIAFDLFHFPDLTIEGSLPLGAAVFATTLRAGWPMLAAFGAAALAGALTGSVTAILSVRFRLDKFLAAILVVAISYSLSLRLMGASNIGLLQEPSIFSLIEDWDAALGRPFRLGTLALLITLTSLGAVLFITWLSSRSGTRIRSAGCNETLARSMGISVAVAMATGLALTNALAALSGALLATYQGFADIGMGMGTLVLAIAAMAIGKAVCPSRRLPFQVFVIVSAIIGSVVYQVIIAYAIRVGLAPTDLKLATALLVLAVIIPRAKKDTELSRGTST